MCNTALARRIVMTLTADRPAAIDFAAARRAMIDSQLRTSGVTDPAVIAAMGSLAREDFVPAAARDHAYIDRAIPLGDGQALPAPLFHGLLLSEAALRPEDTVLLVGCGSDYLAALVRPLVAKLDVVAVDAAAARKTGRATYSVLLVDGAIEALPAGLTATLTEGGRIVTGLVERGVTRLAAGRKIGGAVTLLPLAELGIPVLGAFAAARRWSF
jgi:protein-L-isoaspartate(D-aspartate) O-methyltransferase